MNMPVVGNGGQWSERQGQIFDWKCVNSNFCYFSSVKMSKILLIDYHNTKNPHPLYEIVVA